MKIKIKINGELTEIDLDQCAIKSVVKEKYQSVDLCVESKPNGFLIPFARIKLYDDDRFISAKETYVDIFFAFDNRTGDCWVELFDDINKAFEWVKQ